MGFKGKKIHQKSAAAALFTTYIELFLREDKNMFIPKSSCQFATAVPYPTLNGVCRTQQYL
ncbi:MAG: hypothetical protein WC292_01770 [Clostridia bacterium]